MGEGGTDGILRLTQSPRLGSGKGDYLGHRGGPQEVGSEVSRVTSLGTYMPSPPTKYPLNPTSSNSLKEGQASST